MYEGQRGWGTRGEERRRDKESDREEGGGRIVRMRFHGREPVLIYVYPSLKSCPLFHRSKKYKALIASQLASHIKASSG